MTKAAPVWRRVCVQTFRSWFRHRCLTESAALSFYTLYSLTPMLIITMAVASTVFGEDAVRGQVVKQFSKLMGAHQAELIQRILQRIAQDGKSGVAAVLGVIAVAIGATALFAQLQSSLNRVWEVTPRKSHPFRALLRKRLVSFALVLGTGFLLVVSLALSAAIDGLQEWIEARFAISTTFLALGNFTVMFLLVTLLFAMIYRFLPDVDIKLREVALGAITASVAVQLGRWLFNLYIARTDIASPYGTAGALVVLLFWVYYATSILLLGAEFARAHSRSVLGSQPQTSAGAERANERR
ncbi:MAG: YihY/virulence factor BrkB family protein [Acidobacteriota bacterium]